MTAGTLQPRTPLRRDPGVRAIIASWRRLTGGRSVRDTGRRTLIACSAGVDSSALAIALASASSHVVLAHIRHDLRPAALAQADCDATAALAARLGLPFATASVAPGRLAGNAEANARRLRYQALARLARAHDCLFVATAHHADDVLETLLMRLVRGAGPAGLGGIHPARLLSPRGLTLVRPMLGLTREDAVRICTAAAWNWSEDHTNQDITRLRAAIRAQVLPVLRRLSPGSSARATRTAALLAQSAAIVRERAALLLDQAKACGTRANAITLPRALLRDQPPVVLGELVRCALKQLGGVTRMDRLGRRSLDPMIGAIADQATQPRVFTIARLVVEVRSRSVLFASGPASDGQGGDANAKRREQPDHGPDNPPRREQ